MCLDFCKPSARPFTLRGAGEPAAGRAPDWVVAVLGIGVVVVFLEITAYYYAMLIGYALLHERDPLAGPVICAFAAISTLLATYGADRGMVFVHAGTSAALIVLVFVSTWRAGRPLSGRAGEDGD